MNKKIFRSTSFMIALVLILRGFINVHALPDSTTQTESRTFLISNPVQAQAFTDNFDSFNNSFWKSGYVWGSNDINMGNGNTANLSILKDAAGSYLCLKSPAVNDIGVVTSVNQFGYGTYTARMKFTASDGTWPSFWALNDQASWEVDAHESLGNNPTNYYMTLHDHGQVGQGVYNGQTSLADQWHIYSFTWTSTDVIFYFDNVVKYSQKYSKPDLINVMFTMGIMGNGTLWNGNRYDATTFAKGSPTLCIDYFSFMPLTVSPTNTAAATSIVPTLNLVSSTPTAISSQTALPTTLPSNVTSTAILVSTALTPTSIPASQVPTESTISALPTNTPVFQTATPTPLILPASPTATQAGLLIPPSKTVYDDKNAAFVYSAGWKEVSRKQAYKNAYKLTSQNGSFMKFTFTGQSFSVLYKGDPAYGKIDVYVDNVLVGSINEYMAKPTYQHRWNFSGQLALGSHTLQLVFVTADASGKTSGSIDAVIVH